MCVRFEMARSSSSSSSSSIDDNDNANDGNDEDDDGDGDKSLNVVCHTRTLVYSRSRYRAAPGLALGKVGSARRACARDNPFSLESVKSGDTLSLHPIPSEDEL